MCIRDSIQEGDMNFSETNIMWKNDVKIALSESLLNYNKSEINLTGKLEFYFKDLNNFYKSFFLGLQFCYSPFQLSVLILKLLFSK